MKPLRIWIVELVRNGATKPVFATLDHDEAETYAHHMNHWAQPFDDEQADRAHAIIRRATALYAALPLDVVDTSTPMEGGVA